MVIGEGKPENQNHALVFCLGEAVQAIDMNQVRAFWCRRRRLWPPHGTGAP